MMPPEIIDIVLGTFSMLVGKMAYDAKKKVDNAVNEERVVQLIHYEQSELKARLKSLEVGLTDIKNKQDRMLEILIDIGRKQSD